MHFLERKLHSQLINNYVSLPCKWENDTIIVMEAIRIVKPYTVDCCSGGTEKNLAHVKRVLEGELRKLKKKRK